MELKSLFKCSMIFLLAAAPASVTLAQSYSTTPCSFSGFTVGIGLGANTLMNNSTTSTSGVSDLLILPSTNLVPTPMEGNSINEYGNHNVYKYGPMGTVFVGYGYAFQNHVYMGTELGVNFLGANKTYVKDTAGNNVTVTSTDVRSGDSGEVNYANSLTLKTKTSRSVAEPFLDLKAGFMMTPTALVFLRGGINYNSYDLKTMGDFGAAGNSFSSVTGSTSASSESGFTSSHKKSRVNYRAGIGMEVMVTPEIGVGADYVYSFYQTLKASSTTSTNDVACDVFVGCQVVDASITNNTQAKLSDQQVTAQLIFHLG